MSVAISAASRNAQAYPFYIDFHGGTGQIRDTSLAMFGGQISGATSLGMNLELGFYYTPIEPRSGVDIQLGLKSSAFSGSKDTYSILTVAPFAVVRIQIWMFYAGFGFSPLVFVRSAESFGFENLGLASSTLAYMGEFGILYAATPKFAMGLSGTGTFYSNNGGFSATPTWTGSFAMRFYFNLFGIGGDAPSQAHSLEYEGWRYIGK